MTDVELPPPVRPREPSDAELHALHRLAFWKRVGFVAAGLALALLLGGVAYTVYTIRSTQVDSLARAKSTNIAAKSAKAASDRIEECTTPGRSCYERGQGEITSAVVDVNRVTVIAASCADKNGAQTYAEVRACVIRGLSDPTTKVPRKTIAKAAAAAAGNAGSSTPGSSSSSPKPRSPKPSSAPSPAQPSSGPSTAPAPSSPPSAAPVPHLLCLEPLANLCLL